MSVVATGKVVTVNAAVVCPAATVTLAGTCTMAVLLLPRLTVRPPVGAGPLIVSVPVGNGLAAVLPPGRLLGLMTSVDGTGASTVSTALWMD